MAYTYAGLRQATAQDQSGTPLPKWSVSVYPRGTQTPAVLYTDRTKATVGPNPVVSDAAGNYWYYAEPGLYDETVVGSSEVIPVEVYADPGEPAAIPTTLQLGSATPAGLGNAATGVSTFAGHEDHVHSHGNLDVDSATTALHHTLGAGGNQAAAGTHTHPAGLGLGSATPAGLGTAIAGTATSASHEDHVHGHGNLDLDGSTTALHHTLGTGASQAAAGNHTHGATIVATAHAGSYTVAPADAGTEVQITGSTAATVTFPTFGTFTTVGTVVIVQQRGTGAVTIAGAGTTVFTSATATANPRTQFSKVAYRLNSLNPDTWDASGDTA